MKATALGPLFMDFLSIFFAAKRDYGAFYHPKKFHTFWCSLSTKNAGGRVAAKMVVPFFGPFLHLRPLFPIENVRILEIVLLHMIEAVYIHNRNSFAP